jgi:hypothetical protein
VADKDAGKNRSGSGEEPKIYINDDTQKRTAPWIIRDYHENGALTDATKAKIAEQFDLTSGLVEELSILVGNSLDAESMISLARVTRGKATTRGRKRLEEAARLARRMKSDHAAIAAHLSHLQTHFDIDQRAATPLAALQEELAGIRKFLGDLEARVGELSEIEYGIAEIAPDDRRHASDMRRIHVVRSCCYVWEDAGRSVSYTSVSSGPGNQRRRGQLIEFVHVVTRHVTDPPTELPVETIRRDIDQFNDLRNKGRI